MSARIQPTQDQKTLMKEIFERKDGQLNNEDYKQLIESTGLPRRYLSGWIGRQRRARIKRSLKTADSSDTEETIRGSSCSLPVSAKPEPKDCELPPPKKKIKLISDSSNDDILSVKAEIAEATVPCSPKPKPHTSTLTAPDSNENIPTRHSNLSHTSHVSDIDPPPSYSQASHTDPACELKPRINLSASSMISTASAIPHPIPASSLADLRQQFNIDPSLPTQKIQQMCYALLAASHTPSTESNISQPQLSPSVFPQSQPQLYLQSRASVNQPVNTSSLALTIAQLLTAAQGSLAPSPVFQPVQNFYPNHNIALVNSTQPSAPSYTQRTAPVSTAPAAPVNSAQSSAPIHNQRTAPMSATPTASMNSTQPSAPIYTQRTAHMSAASTAPANAAQSSAPIYTRRPAPTFAAPTVPVNSAQPSTPIHTQRAAPMYAASTTRLQPPVYLPTLANFGGSSSVMPPQSSAVSGSNTSSSQQCAQMPDLNTFFFDNSQLTIPASTPDSFNSQMTPLQHLHVLEPLLNANQGNTSFASISAFDTNAVANLLSPQSQGQVMDRLLDQQFVEGDPFQASMGLVWMQDVGLIQ